MFGGVADVYEATRPGYPGEAIQWLLGPKPLPVLELGAGTGKLTADLVSAGHDVVATEPSDPMLTHLARRIDAAAVRCGAEQLPFRAGSFDAVVVAQAFHWFDPSEAVPEIARALRPGGHIALVWNFRDESVPWVRRLSAIIGSEDFDDELQLDSLAASGLFAAPTSTEFRFWQQLNRDGLLGLVRSRSYVAALDPEPREDLLTRVGELYDEFGRGNEGIRMPYRTECYRAQVVKDSASAPDAEPHGGGDVLFDFR